MPYRLVLTVACVVLTLRHVLDPTASARSRLIVAALTVTSFLLPGRELIWYVSAIVLQLGVSLAVLLRRAARAA